MAKVTKKLKTAWVKKIRVLSRKHLECFLLYDELIKKLCKEKGHPEKEAECLAAKKEAIDNSVQQRGNPRDDIKSASGEICNGLKKILRLTQCGNKTHSFLRDTMAPLLTPKKKLQKTVS